MDTNTWRRAPLPPGGTARLLAVVTMLTAGCSHAQTYRPVQREGVAVEDVAGTRHLLPRGAPTGEIRVASFGAYDLQPEAGGPPFATVHVRLVVLNERDPVPWVLDVRALELAVPGEGKTPALYANSDAPGLPVVSVAQGQRQTIDAYFPLPALPRNKIPGRVDVCWEITVGPRPAAACSGFVRGASTAADDATMVGRLGGAAHWWHDPYYPRVGVFAHQGLLMSLPPQPNDLRVQVRARKVPPLPAE